MQIRKLLGFLLQTVMAGLAAAFIYILVVEPELISGDSRDVELTVSEEPPRETAPIATASPAQGPVSYADAVSRAAPGVVNIHTAKVITRRVHPLLDDPIFQRFFGQQFSRSRKEVQTSLGSGVLLSGQGYLLTNNHVIDGADEIQVLLADGRSYRAVVVGADADTDLAVLQIESNDLPSVIIGNSDNLRVGDVTLAIGNPFGVGQTVTLGIISATGRNELGINAFEDFIQTDAAINPGNSGGALINAKGELIGINSAIYSRSGGSQGIGFAIPINLAKDIMTQIIEQGQVVRGWLGIEAQDLTPNLAMAFNMPTNIRGVLISGVLREGPADQAGLQPGDVVTEIDSQTVKDARTAMNEISARKPGTAIELAGLRGGNDTFRIEVQVIQRPQQPLTQN